MLILFIPGKETVKNENIDVYLQLVMWQSQEDHLNLCWGPSACGACLIILRMAYLLVAKQKAIWHAFSVVQKWILDVPPTWKKICILDTDITMLEATHIGEIMMYSIDKWSSSLHHLEFLLLNFYKGLKNVRHGWQEDSTH
jgi:hypothetical protein